MFFFGQFEHNLDAKGRLIIPAAFRTALPGGVYLTRGLDGNLAAYSYETFEKISTDISKKSIPSVDMREFNRFYFSQGNKLEFDTVGRILIPSYLQTYAGLNTQVIIAGAGINFEIWSPERWALQMKKFDDPEVVANRWNELEITT